MKTLKMGCEDLSYCHDVFSAGLRCAYEPKAIATHYEMAFRNKNTSKLHEKWWRDSYEYLHNKHKGLSFVDYCPTLLWD